MSGMSPAHAPSRAASSSGRGPPPAARLLPGARRSGPGRRLPDPRAQSRPVVPPRRRWLAPEDLRRRGRGQCRIDGDRRLPGRPVDGRRQGLPPGRALGPTTDPYSADVRARILPGNHNLKELCPRDWESLFLFFDVADRLVTGSYLGRTVNDTPGRASRVLGRALARIFPDLGTPEFTYHWSGCWDVSPRRMAGIHRLAEGFWCVVGFSGRGIPTGTAVGKELAADGPAAMRMPITPVPRALFPKLPMSAWHNLILPVLHYT